MGWMVSYYTFKKIKAFNYHHLLLWSFANEDTFDALFDESFDSDIFNEKGQSILHLAYFRHDFQTMNHIILLKSSKQSLFDVNAIANEDKTVLMYVCEDGQSLVQNDPQRIIVLKSIMKNLFFCYIMKNFLQPIYVWLISKGLKTCNSQAYV